jgi:hypothetical protein
MKLILRAIRLISAALQVLLSVLAMTVAAPPVVAQKGANETVTQTAIEQFKNNPLISISLGKDAFMFSGDGGDVLAIAAQDSTLLIDSGISSRVSELSDAIHKTTWRPVTRLVSTQRLYILLRRMSPS